MQERPDGSVATPIGWFLIMIGIVGAFAAANAETTNGLLLGVALANLGLGLGVVLVSLGYLVKAIWFLPGREISADQVEATTSAQLNKCEWCDRAPSTGKPCSNFSENGLLELSRKVRNPICQSELGKRGYGPIARI